MRSHRPVGTKPEAILSLLYSLDLMDPTCENMPQELRDSCIGCYFAARSHRMYSPEGSRTQEKMEEHAQPRSCMGRREATLSQRVDINIGLGPLGREGQRTTTDSN